MDVNGRHSKLIICADMPRPKREKAETPFTKNFNKILRERRLSIKQVAELMGLPYTTAVGIAGGATPTDMEAISRFCTALNVDFEWLLTGKIKNFDASQIPLDQIFEEERESSFSGIYKIEAKKLLVKVEKKKGQL